MANHLFIIPGYSDEDFSFLPLRNLLVHEKLYKEENIYSIEYASLDNQADFRDFADRLDDIYNALTEDGKIDARIDVLAHSTGSLVVRSWLYLRRKRQKARNQKIDLPVEHLFLFAPANFGSDLAKIGQSPLNALRATFTKLNRTATLIGNQDPFETGKKVLQGLEPASPLQWELSLFDLHEQTYFGEHDLSKEICFPFVFAAGKFADESLESFFVSQLRKDGTDNTVRIAGTSLNTRKCILRANHNPPVEWDEEWLDDIEPRKRRKFEDIAFAIFGNYDHCGIINDKGKCKPRDINSSLRLPDDWEPLKFLKQAKEIDSPEKYKELSQEFRNKTNDYKYSRDSIFQQFFFKVIDDTGAEVTDYFIKFCVYDANIDLNAVDPKTNKPHKSDENLTKKFIESFGSGNDFHVHSVNPSHRALMIDIKKNLEFIKTLQDKKIVMEVIAKSPYRGVSFPDAKFVIYQKQPDNNSPNFFFPYTTTLVEIIIDRKVDPILLGLGDFSPGSGEIKKAI